MSVSSIVSRNQFTITSLYGVFNTSIVFNQAADLLVNDGAVLLVLNSDYTVTGGGYNAQNQLQTGLIALTNTGVNAAKISIGDKLTVVRGISPVQTTSFTSTGELTPIMIEQDDDKLTTLVQQLIVGLYNPFPLIQGGPQEIFLGWITAETGGIPTSIDSLNVTSIVPYGLPLLIGVSIGDVYFKWKLRAIVSGDPGVTTLPNYIVPVTNPLNLIWVSQ